MIVADTNLIACLYLPSELTPQAEALFVQDPDWRAPILWRSELRNVLALYLRKGLLEFERAYAIQREAEALLADREYDSDSLTVLRLAHASGCSAYDCEFIALAQRLGVRVVTQDRKLIASFPELAVPLAALVH